MMIHLIWWQGADRVPDHYHDNIAELRRLNPGYRVCVWDRTSVQRVVHSMGPLYTKALGACQHLHQRVDFARYCVVYWFGGISVDMDAKPLKPFAPLVRRIPEDRLGVSEFKMSAVEASLFTLRAQTWWLNNATLIARRPRNEACKILVDKVAHRLLSPFWWSFPPWIAVLVTTGPLYFMSVFIHDIDSSLFHVIPYRYLEPCVGNHAYCVVPRDAILHHQHAGTWLPGWYRTAQQGWYACRSWGWMTVGVAVSSMVLMMVLSMRRR